MATVAAANPTGTTTIADFVPHPGHVLVPLLLGLVSLGAAVFLTYTLIRGRQWAGRGDYIAKGAAAAALLGVAAWQLVTFWHRLEAWARPLGGVGAAFVGMVGLGLLVWAWAQSDGGGSHSSGGGSTTITYRTHISHSREVNVANGSPYARQSIRPTTTYSHSTVHRSSAPRSRPPVRPY